MAVDTAVDAEALRDEVRKKYREVAANPYGTYHFHTGRPLAARLGYELAVVDALPDAAVESFAGVANPLSLRRLCSRASASSMWDQVPVSIALSQPIMSGLPAV